MKKSRFCLSLLPLFLLSCGQPATPSSTNSDSTISDSSGLSSVPSLEFVEKQINAYYLDASFNDKTNIRFYGDSSIPYISLKEFVRLLYRGRSYEKGRDKFEVKKNGSIYECSVASGAKAYFDIAKNTFESDDYALFKSTHMTEPGIKGVACYDGLPFIKIKEVKVDKAPKKMTISFSDYGFRIYGDEQNVYVPVTFASDLFSNENLLVGAYNGQDIYVYYYMEGEYYSQFGQSFFNPILKDSIKKEYAEFLYNELCLDYDFFLGRPGRSSLEKYYDLSHGLDAALSSRPLGQLIKRYLTSTKPVEYLAGTVLLGYLRNDGGHSGYNSVSSVSSSPAVAEHSQAALELATQAVNEGYEELVNQTISHSHHTEMRANRANALGKTSLELNGNDTYTKVGETAYIHIDGFMGEIHSRDKWEDYYSGKTSSLPFSEHEGGAVTSIYNGLNKANKDSSVKNVIVDLSSNTGGSTDEMLFMISLLTNHNTLYCRDYASDQMAEIVYDIDRNLDRVFDEKDYEEDFVQGKNLAVLTSQNGFSCGGISPIYLHDYGLYTLGDHCGGGSCSIYIQHDAYGGVNRCSSPHQIYSPNLVSVDVEYLSSCDTPLEIKEIMEEGATKLDYSSFFDTETLNRLIQEHYKG